MHQVQHLNAKIAEIWKVMIRKLYSKGIESHSKKLAKGWKVGTKFSALWLQWWTFKVIFDDCQTINSTWRRQIWCISKCVWLGFSSLLHNNKFCEIKAGCATIKVSERWITYQRIFIHFLKILEKVHKKPVSSNEHRFPLSMTSSTNNSVTQIMRLKFPKRQMIVSSIFNCYQLAHRTQLDF